MIHALFNAYPDGRSGLALFALRAALGSALVVQGGRNLIDPFKGWPAILAGLFLILGLYTQIVSLLTALGAVVVGVFLTSGGVMNLFDAISSAGFAAAIVVAIILLGPGWFSIDARLFGRREIIIPRVAQRK